MTSPRTPLDCKHHSCMLVMMQSCAEQHTAWQRISYQDLMCHDHKVIIISC